MQGITSGDKRKVVKMAKAKGDCTTLGDSIGVQGSSEGLAEGVAQHNRAHGHNIIKQPHEAGVAVKWDAPA